MFEPITTRQLTEHPRVKLVYINPETGEEIEDEFNLQKFIQRYTSLYEQYMHHGKYSVIGKFCDRLIWTFQIKTACTDGIRMFVNPLFARQLEKNRETTVMEDVKELVKKGKNWKDPSVFDVKYETAKYFFFIVMHECYHMIYRHVEQSKRKPETANGGEYIHWLANTSMDIEINRDIEKQWPEFQGTTEAIDGWFKPEYGNKVWTVIFDERYAAGEQMPDNSQPVIPTQRLNPPGGGGQQPQNGDDNKREYEAAQDYVDGWTKALEDYKAGKLDPRNFNPLPVDKSKFSHQVLGFLTEAASNFNQDEYNQGYNDAVIAIINAMNAQGGGGGGGDVKITNLPPPPSFGGGGEGEGDSSQQNQQQQNQQNQNGGGGAANSSQQIDKMDGQQAANSAQQSANNAKQSAQQAQQAADAAKQKANQSGSQADQQAADNAQAAADAAQSAADAAQKAADAAKNAAGNGNDQQARDKAKDAANAANQAQQAANQAKQQAGHGGGKQSKPITNSKDLGDNKSGNSQSPGAANSSQEIDKMSGQQAANSAQQSANNAKQSAQQAQQAADAAKQKAGQSGSSADKQAANNAQKAADAAKGAADKAQSAADASKDAAANGNDQQARDKAKDAADAASQAQQSANQAKQQAGQQSGQNGQQGQQAGQQGQQQGNQQNGQQQGDSSDSQQSGQEGQTAQNGEIPTYKVTGGHKWKDQGGDLISTEEGCKIMEGEGEDISREINKTPEDHIKKKMAELGKKLQDVGKNAGRGYTMGERLAEIAKSLESPKIKWRRLLLRHFKNLGTKPQEEYKRKLSRSEEDRADWNEKIVPYKQDMETRNSADIFYLVDASGSISDTDLQIVFRELIGLEIKEDLDIRKSAFVYFSDNFDESRIRVWYKDTDDKEKMRMVKYVSGKDAAGGTDISGSIVHVTQLKKSKNRAMRDLYSRTDPMTLIIVFTDGCEGGSFSQVGNLPRSIRDKIVFVILNTESESWGFNTVVPQIIQSAKVAPKNIVCIDTQKDLVR